MIEHWNPVTSPEDCNYTIPYDDLVGTTPQEKANYYLNMSDEDPVKMGMRRDVCFGVMMNGKRLRKQLKNLAKQV